MTNSPTKYRLTRHTEDGLLKRYITVDDRTVEGGLANYLLIDAHITIAAPNFGLISGNDDKTSTAKHGRDAIEEFPDLASANSAAKTLYEKYLSEGWQDETE